MEAKRGGGGRTTEENRRAQRIFPADCRFVARLRARGNVVPCKPAIDFRRLPDQAVLKTKTWPFSVPTARSVSSPRQANLVAADGILTSATIGFFRLGA